MSHNGHTHFKNLEVKCTDFFIEKKIKPLIDNIPQGLFQRPEKYVLREKRCDLFLHFLQCSYIDVTADTIHKCIISYLLECFKINLLSII